MTAGYEYKIRIQRGIKMPAIKTRGKGGRKPAIYPWDQMQVGDSFLFPASVGRAAYAAAIQASKGVRKFKAVRTVDGMRCWRTR